MSKFYNMDYVEVSVGNKKYQLSKTANKKFDKGLTPCGSCNSNQHHICRPRLDGELCSCSCPEAVGFRLFRANLNELAIEAGRELFSMTEAWYFFNPRRKYKQEY